MNQNYLTFLQLDLKLSLEQALLHYQWNIPFQQNFRDEKFLKFRNKCLKMQETRDAIKEKLVQLILPNILSLKAKKIPIFSNYV